MRFAVEAWDPDYGSATGDGATAESLSDVDAFVEAPDAGSWGPVSPPRATSPAGELVVVDGVRRVDATVWLRLPDEHGEVVDHRSLCASFAAGAVRCDGRAELVAAEVGRGLFTAAPGAETIRDGSLVWAPVQVESADPDALSLRLQRSMGSLEAEVAAAGGPAEVTLVDGPLHFGQERSGFVGYVKTHRAAYGPPVVRSTVALLEVGQRTPVMLVRSRPRFTWYLRLPGPVTHGWAGIVRLEVAADREVADAVSLADRLAVTLPSFASTPESDARAPQNLVPIGGLERRLRHRLGDPDLLLRALRRAAGA